MRFRLCKVSRPPEFAVSCHKNSENILPLGDFIQMNAMRHIVIIISIFLTAFTASSQVRFDYDVDFEMNFDNREFYRSNFSKSMTIFGARLTPSVGLEAFSADSSKHRIMVGIDVMKDFGASPISEYLAGGQTNETLGRQNNLSLFREITLYYDLQKKIGDTGISLYAGIFSRDKMQGRYSQAFFSDSLKFYDNNLEGLLVQFHRPKAEFEVGCDWMGQYGSARRERFMIFSSGEGNVTPILRFGYSGYMYHFANSQQVKGLVDNILLNPYARIDLAHLFEFQAFSATLGWIQALQHNRKHVGYYVFPGGGHFDLELRNWDVAVKNMLYYGADLMPYYNYTDEGGFKYGSELYLGDPFYRVYDDNTSRHGLYDRLEVCYEPSVGKYLNVKVAAVFHFNNFHYSGCQQVVGLKASF